MSACEYEAPITFPLPDAEEAFRLREGALLLQNGEVDLQKRVRSWISTIRLSGHHTGNDLL